MCALTRGRDRSAMYRVGAARPHLAILSLLLVALAGCSGPYRAAVPVQLADKAHVPDVGNVRVWGDAPFAQAMLAPDLPKLKASYLALAKSGKPVVADLL